MGCVSVCACVSVFGWTTLFHFLPPESIHYHQPQLDTLHYIFVFNDCSPPEGGSEMFCFFFGLTFEEEPSSCPSYSQRGSAAGRGSRLPKFLVRSVTSTSAILEHRSNLTSAPRQRPRVKPKTTNPSECTRSPKDKRRIHLNIWMVHFISFHFMERQRRTARRRHNSTALKKSSESGFSLSSPPCSQLFCWLTV